MVVVVGLLQASTIADRPKTDCRLISAIVRHLQLKSGLVERISSIELATRSYARSCSTTIRKPEAPARKTPGGAAHSIANTCLSSACGGSVLGILSANLPICCKITRLTLSAHMKHDYRHARAGVAAGVLSACAKHNPMRIQKIPRKGAASGALSDLAAAQPQRRRHTAKYGKAKHCAKAAFIPAPTRCTT